MAELEKRYMIALVEYTSDSSEDEVQLFINGKNPARFAVVSIPIDMGLAGKERVFREVVKSMEKHEHTSTSICIA